MFILSKGQYHNSGKDKNLLLMSFSFTQILTRKESTLKEIWVFKTYLVYITQENFNVMSVRAVTLHYTLIHIFNNQKSFVES